MIDYDSIQTEAASAIENAGYAMTLTRSVHDFDYRDGKTWASDSETYTVYGVLTGISYAYGKLRGQNSYRFTVQAGDSIAIVSATGEEVKQNDLLDDWKVIQVDPLAPGGTTLLYRCHLRK